MLFFPLTILLAASLATLYSISPHLFLLQLVWIGLGAGVATLFLFFDWRMILNYRWVITGFYVFVVLLLAVTYVTSPAVRNVRSWIFLGPLSFQPVELAKVALVLIYASYFSRRHVSIARWKNITASFLFFIVPAALTALQPDLGSALVLFGIWFGFLLLSGLPQRRVVTALLVFVLVGGVGWAYGLKEYQKARIRGVFYPEHNELGINYSVAQSKIAIGSSGFWGKGYGQGSQVQLGFLTEPASDFILAAFVEEWGIFGAMVVVLSFLWLVFQILKIGAKHTGNFEKFICLGAAAVFGFQFIVNVGSELGLAPVIGVTFPFLSYGGSSLVSDFLLVSLVNAIDRK